MSSFTNKDLRENIRTSLGFSEDTKAGETIEEAYVARAKSHRLTTEMLSENNKSNHVDLYEGYVKKFNY